MKIIKIILPIAVIVLIVFFVWNSLLKPDVPVEIPPTGTDNEVILEYIKNDIDSLSRFPVDQFCQAFYNDVQSSINQFHDESLFSTNETANNQWKEILSKNLFTTYALKFIDQSMNVFSGSEWKSNDLSFIRNEVNVLKESPYIDATSSVASKFKEINDVLKKYDEIIGFIASCNSFSYNNYGIYDIFPDVSEKINKSQSYLNNNLENEYVNNCTKLKDGLRAIPRMYYEKHINFLKNKIIKNSNRYKEFKSQPIYADEIFRPLRGQLYAVSRDMYKVISYEEHSSNFSNLEKLLDSDSINATEYFRSLLY